MASAESAEPKALTHHQLPQAWVLAAFTHLGLLAVCASAVYTLQPPDFPRGRWMALALLALAALAQAAISRGRAALSSNGKSLTALLAGAVLSLSYDPQVANWPGVGEKLPAWLSGLNPSLATVGVVWAGVCGAIYLGAFHTHQRGRHPAPYVWTVLATAALIMLGGVATYVVLSRVYEVDSLSLGLLVSQAVQYGWLLAVVLGLSGRIGVGATMPVYLALTVLLALARNLHGGGQG
jgi:hypothetical protein